MALALPAEWRSQQCDRCGHEWARLIAGQYVCARCNLPERRGETRAELVTRLQRWIAEQERLRSGCGTYAKGQLVILRMLRRQLG